MTMLTRVGSFTAQMDMQRMLNVLLLLLSIAFGCVCGMLAARFVDLSVEADAIASNPAGGRRAAVRQLTEADFQIILERNLFNSADIGNNEAVDLSASQLPTTTPQKSTGAMRNPTLLGTVVAGEESLALLKLNNEAGVFRLQDEVAPELIVTEIGRKMVVVTDRGKRRELYLNVVKPQTAQSVSKKGNTAGSAGQGIASDGDNRWRISKDAVENARNNLNVLMQSARAVPQVENGQTVGFKLVRLQRGSLLEQIGLRTGDLLVEVNQVKLDSPEKGLQIFQQLREANNISLGLQRGGKPMTFEYRFE